MTVQLSFHDWLSLLTHFLSLSLLAVGGAITTVPDMHRYLVSEQHWLSEAQFNASIALAQAAPGPNVLFVALMGWNVGMNAAGGLASGTSAWLYALLGTLLCMVGILLPSASLTFAATRWGHRNRERPGVKAFKQGMAPLVIALLVATGWVLTSAHGAIATHPALWFLTVASMILIWRTRVHMLWVLGAGAIAGMLGWV